MTHPLQAAQRLRRLYVGGELGGQVMPEDAVAKAVPAHELLTVLTLGMALNYQRNSYRLWESVAACYSFEPDRWVLDPGQVTVAAPGDVGSVLVKHRVALQPVKHLQIWSKLCTTFDSTSGGVQGFIDQSGHSVVALREEIGRRKRDFPYLGGPKIFNYWVYVLEGYCGIRWVDREHISVAPDTHVVQASVALGLVQEGSSPSEVADAWAECLDGSGMCPVDVHTPLWLWNRAGRPVDETGAPASAPSLFES